MARELERWQLAERSMIKKYRKEIWNPFIAAIKRYELIQAGDRIAVCISGGKDSMLLALLMNDQHFLRCACRFSERAEASDGSSKRQETKALIKQMRTVNPNVEINLFASLHKVNLDTLPGYKQDGQMHSFLEKL